MQIAGAYNNTRAFSACEANFEVLPGHDGFSIILSALSKSLIMNFTHSSKVPLSNGTNLRSNHKIYLSSGTPPR